MVNTKILNEIIDSASDLPLEYQCSLLVLAEGMACAKQHASTANTILVKEVEENEKHE